MPLEIQWFIYALISNEALTPEDAVAIYDSLGEEVNFEAYAQAVLEHMASGYDEESLNALVEQIQSVVEFAVTQGATGNAPPLELPESGSVPAAPAAAP